MKKALLITATVALLGIMAAYVNPLGPEKKAIGPVATPATNSSSGSTTEVPATAPSTRTDTAPVPAAQATGYKDGTYKGGDYSSQYGDVQVSITIQDGKISAVNFDKLTAYDGHSREINDYAGPYLKSQTLSAQSYQIDGVSGATYTSTDYVRSLQSALDKARA